MDFDPEIDYYEILQVHPTAHQEVIKRAFRTIVGLLQAHPDLGGTHEEALRVNKAYQVLSNPSTRKAYDAARERAKKPEQPSPRHTTPHHAAGNGMATAHAPRRETSAMRTLTCPRCGARNRLPASTRQGAMICGKCHAPLTPGQAESGGDAPLADHLRLPSALANQLSQEGEISVCRTRMPVNHRLRCLRCRHEWSELASALPTACPHCHSTQWSEFRLFQCRHCGHRFSTNALTTSAYQQFTACPACQQTHWHTGYERHPLNRFFDRLTRRTG